MIAPLVPEPVRLGYCQPSSHDGNVQLMAKLIVQHDEDPGIAIILEEWRISGSNRFLGWHGTCTQCGRVMHRWGEHRAIESAREHVDRHESAL
jgi:hypothetical protein